MKQGIGGTGLEPVPSVFARCAQQVTARPAATIGPFDIL